MKSRHILFWVWGCFLLLPLPALAEEGKAALPQMDVNLFAGQLFWLAIFFPLLYVLMAKVGVPAVQRTQDKRRQILKDDLNAATAASEQAKALQEGYEKALAEARTKAKGTVNEIILASTREAAAQQEVQHQDLNKRVAEAEERIAAVRDEALRDVRNVAAELAATIVEKLSGFRIGATR